MKGLLTKDFALLAQRKRTFLFLAAWAVVMTVTMENTGFMVGWLTVIGAFFAVSSMTYDEYDNCCPFLMSLPADGKTYAMEKYLFSFLCGLGAWLFAVIVTVAALCFKGRAADIGEELLQAAVFLPVMLLMTDVSLPLNLKYGSEKGRMTVLILFGAVFLGIFAITGLTGNGSPADAGLTDLSEPVGALPVLIALIASAAITVGSAAISVRIMKKKEF